MIVVLLGLLGVCAGSFVSALTWRLQQQESSKRKKKDKKLSIVSGRSMCAHCKHQLAANDLVPVISWLALRGRCRYCGKPIADTPLPELAGAALFIGSYIWWPRALQGSEWTLFGIWLVLLTGLLALTVYDLKWYILPNRIVYPLFLVAVAWVGARLAIEGSDVIVPTILGLAVGGGLFYALFQASKGKWIGGGDVKLGALLGVFAGGVFETLLLLFLASALGSLISVPLLITKKATRSTHIPFGPFLISAAIIVRLFGEQVLTWYGLTL